MNDEQHERVRRASLASTSVARIRRLLVAILALVVTLGASSIAAVAQPAKVYRIGFLGNSTAVLETNLVGPFRDALRELG